MLKRSELQGDRREVLLETNALEWRQMGGNNRVQSGSERFWGPNWTLVREESSSQIATFKDAEGDTAAHPEQGLVTAHAPVRGGRKGALESRDFADPRGVTSLTQKAVISRHQ
jgi:hypothetical protein